MKTDERKIIKIICDSMIFLGAVMLCMPIIIMFTNSFESPRQILDYYYSGKTFTAFRLVPEILSADQYYAALIDKKEYVTALMNSVEYAIISAFAQLLCAAVSAYGLSLCRVNWAKWVIAGLLFMMLICRCVNRTKTRRSKKSMMNSCSSRTATRHTSFCTPIIAWVLMIGENKKCRRASLLLSCS